MTLGLMLIGVGVAVCSLAAMPWALAGWALVVAGLVPILDSWRVE